MKIFIETLGCPKNAADSETAAGILEDRGHEMTGDPSEADVIMVNTCGFINDAKQESIDRIFDMADCKMDGGLLVVSGCLSQRYQDQLYKEMPEVDIFIGVNEYGNLPEILEQHKAGNREKVFQAYEKECLSTAPRKLLAPSYTACLKIAEGCDNICAYCVIPAIRGGYRSKKQEDVITEAKSLADSGCRELILIAQDVSAYGIDLYGEYRLASLLRELCKIEGLRWIRLMYCYEDRITDELIQTMKEEEKICHYIDIPLQHASDAVLSAMNRRSTKASITDTLSRLRTAMPDIHIRTTLITGFPGETKEDFEELEQFVSEMRFERLGVFAYSKEEGTPAAAMKGQVRAQTKVKRKEGIMAIQREVSLAQNQEKIGSTLEIMVEEPDAEAGTWLGRSVYDAPEIDNGVIFTSARNLEPGELVQVRITDAFDYDLVGEEVC